MASFRPARRNPSGANTTATPATQSRSNPVSGRCLPKSGIFQISAGDFRRVRPTPANFRVLKTGQEFTEAHHWRGFLQASGPFSLMVELVGWRRSTDRARLQMDTLQTGNFIGKFAVLGITEAILAPKTAVPQPLLESFPRQINRENNSTNRDLPRRIREFRVGNCGAVLICACPSKLDLHRRPHAYSCRFQSSIGSFECNVALDMRLRHRNSFTNLCATS